MAENRDMANLEARLTTLGSQVEHLAEIVPQAGVSSEDDWMTNDWMDRINDFMEVMKQAKRKLSSFSRLEKREENVETREESLVREAAQMTKREELLSRMTADVTKRQELSEQKAAEITKREELLEQNAAELKKRGELLDHRASEILKGEELLEQKTIAINEREALIQRQSLELQESSKIHAASQATKAKEADTLTTREAQVTKVEKALEQRRKADEEMIQRREDNVNHARESLDRHQQIVVQLHQSTKEQLDRVRVEQDDMIASNVTISKQLGAHEARVQGLIKNLRKLKSSIAAPLHNCEVALIDIKEQARSLNIFEAEQRQGVTSLNNELAQVSTSTDRHTATMRSISKDIEAIDTSRTRILRQLEGISGKLVNVAKVSTGLEALSMKFQDVQVAEFNATESMTGAAEELRKATETGSKARDALQRILIRQNASLLNDNISKRGLGPSSPENTPTKRRFVRGSSAGAAEVLANVGTPGLLVNTIRAFGNSNERRRPSFEPPRITSSPALNPTSATRQDPIVNPTPNAIVPQSQENDLELELLMASGYVRDVWRQIEFPADWTTADSAELLDKLNKAKARKGGSNNRYWPQQAMDIGSKLNAPYCLMKDLKKGRMNALEDPRPCESHASDRLMCINVSFSTDNPGEYDSTATDKRWRLKKRQ